MAESRLLAGRLSCSCTVCITWRRLGCELTKGHHHTGYLGAALSHLRISFNDLLDFRSLNGIEEAPVAEGVAPQTGGTPPSPPTPASHHQAGGSVEAGGGDCRPEVPKKESHLEASPKVEKKRKKRKDRDRHNKSSERPERRASRSEHSRARSKRSQAEYPQSPKEESSDWEGAGRDSRGLRQLSVTPEEREARTRTPTRRSARSEAESEVLDKSPAPDRRLETPPREEGAEGDHPTEPPPGRWVLSERSRPSYVPAGQRRPPEPAGPPPGWRWPQPTGSYKSRGVVRRQRSADIAAHGFDPERKRLREQRHG